LTGASGRVSGADHGTATHLRQRCRSIGKKRMTVQYGRLSDVKNPERQLRKIGGTRRANVEESTTVCRQSRSEWWIYVESMRERTMLQAVSATARWETIPGGNGTPGQAGCIHCASVCSRPPATTFGGALLAMWRLRRPVDAGVWPGVRRCSCTTPASGSPDRETNRCATQRRRLSLIW